MSNLVFRSMHSTAPAKKSALRSFYEKMGGGAALSRAKLHAMATGAAVRQGGEAVVVGGLLGAAHVQLKTGLDLQIPVGSNTVNVPLDAVVGVTGLVAGVALAHEEFGTDLRNAGAAAVTVFAFRKTYDALAERKRASGGVPGGKFAGESANVGNIFGEDPLITAARNL